MYNSTPDPNVLFPNKRSQNNNPFSQFTPITYPILDRNNEHKFADAYNMNEPMIERHNFRNQNNTIHNNLHAHLQSEFINNYTIDIDSKDRDTGTYQDPFRYVVTFAPVTKGIDRHEEWVDPYDHTKGKHTVTTTYQGNVAPYIAKSFRNIKYIKIDSVVLPKYWGIKYDTGSSSWVLDTTKNLMDDRFVTLKLKNVTSTYNLSTNTTVETTGIKLIPDQRPTNGNFYYAVPANTSSDFKTYNMSLLGNLDRLNVEFYDSSGNLLKYDNLDPLQSITDVRNPANINLQNNITIIVGVVENELATEVNYTH